MLKKIFLRNDDNINKTAFLNWRTNGDAISNLLVLADGYLSAGLELTQKCLDDNKVKEADKLIFPILHNINHGIELYLKALTWMLNILLKNENKIEGRHNILQIYNDVKSKIILLGEKNEVQYFKKETKNLKLYLIELYELINESPCHNNIDFSRYPLTDKYVEHFYVKTNRNVEIDLENLKLRFQNIYNELEDLLEYYYFYKYSMQ